LDPVQTTECAFLVVGVPDVDVGNHLSANVTLKKKQNKKQPAIFFINASSFVKKQI
jgi:hypothetical protein